MSPVTKNTYIDNWNSEIEGTVEIGVGKKKAFVEHRTCKIINRDNISKLETYQAFRLALHIAKLHKHSQLKNR